MNKTCWTHYLSQLGLVALVSCGLPEGAVIRSYTLRPH